jgi:hypothetical protein
MNYTIFTYFLSLTTLCFLAIDTVNTDTRYFNADSYQQINFVLPRRNSRRFSAIPRYHNSDYRRPNPHAIDLWTCSASQLAQYFFYHGYSEKEILSHNTLYMSDEFVKLAKTYPGYKAAITDLHKKLIKWTRLGNFFRKVWGSYCTGLTERIHYLYQEIQHRKQVVNAQANSQSNTTATCSLVKRWQQNAAACQDHNTKKRLEKRIKAAPKNGPAIAYVLYQEYVDILETASHIPKQGNEILRDTIGQASSIGLEANKAGYLETASQLADFCWTILDYTKAVGEGICLGATNTVHTLTHPVQTVKNALIGIATIAYGLTKVVGAVGKCGLLYVIDSDRYYIRRDIIIDQLKTITKDASNYLASTSARDVIKHGTAFVTEGLLLAKTVTLARDLSCRMLPVAMKYFEYITIEEPFACLVDGELIAIEIPKGMNLHSLEGNILKLNNQPMVKYGAADVEEVLPRASQATTKIVDAVNQTSEAILKNGYYEVNGFRFSEFYYNKLWKSGRGAPSLAVQAILDNPTNVIPDPAGYSGFFKYFTDEWEMVYNPTTKIVSHIQPIRNKRI